MSLAIKYRPKKLEDFFGNDELINSLTSILNREREKIPHVFLLTGRSGCGKTSLGRIIADKLGCDPAEYYEHNAASLRGIDNIREIERNCLYPPMAGEARVWLFDELHQYNMPTQEAMLKMLEEAPEHAYFILCTTDPQRLKSTLKGRAVSFEVKPLDEEDMGGVLDYILEMEELELLPEKIIHRIYRESDGCPRNALQMLEKIIDLDEDDMLENIDKAAASESVSFDLCRLLIQRKSWKEVVDVLNTLEMEPETMRQAILGYADKVLLDPKNKPETRNQAALVIECFSNYFFASGKAGVTLACYQCIV